MSDLAQLSQRIAERFAAAFGRTPLAERVQDILAQATTLGRYADMAQLQDEAGDLLCSVLQLCTECGWEPGALAAATLDKIDTRKEIYARLGRKLRVALLGGAFDPVHVGHVEVATEVLRAGGVDEVWMMPCYEHLAGKSMALPDHRLEMCRLAIRTAPRVGVFDYEIRHQFRGETYHLVKKLLAEEVARVRCDFSLVIGQDNADAFSTWTNAEGLERLLPFLVVARPGCPPPRPTAWYLRPPHRFLEPSCQEFVTSSTEVRRLLRASDPAAAKLVAPDVLAYIRANGLYQPDIAAARPCVRDRRVAVFTGTFDPPTRYHRNAAEALIRQGFDEVVISPTGPQAGRGEPEHAAALHRAALVDQAFRGLSGVRVDLTTLDEARFAQPEELEARHGESGEAWHVLGADGAPAGQDFRAWVYSRWEDGAALWARSRFAVFHPSANPPPIEDLPPIHHTVPLDGQIAPADVRARIYAGEKVDQYLTPEVAGYIARHRLFVPFVPERARQLRLTRLQIMTVFDERNDRAAALARRYERFAGDAPSLILVIGGDGTMLRAIRQFWRLRVPFLGLNAGHLGFLMNERLTSDLQGLELVTYAMPMLRADAEAPDGRTTSGLAYSDTWLEREGGQAAWLRLDVDGQTRVPKIVGDGMLVATASGSSAYARAMGAVPVPLNTPALTLVGSNVFQPRFWRPMTLLDDATVTLASLDTSGKRPVRGYIDGQPLGVVQALTIRRSPIAGVELAFTRQFDPSDKLLRSLFPRVDDSGD
jgi:nicotinate (nicotinamide) nucleotide adenylyltransferase